jgi:hypothetical protein
VTTRPIGDVEWDDGFGHAHGEVGRARDVDRKLVIVQSLRDLGDVSSDSSRGSAKDLQNVEAAAHG